MHRYFIKIPWWIRKLYPSYIWKIPTTKNEVFLSFDDGPHPAITSWVLDVLKDYNARASFFCIGNNVLKFPDIYERILAEGHSVGNHTFDHLNGWETPDSVYLENIKKAAELIDSNLFRPPYGRIKKSQAKQLSAYMNHSRSKIIMWDVLSGDFDQDFSPQQCFDNVMLKIQPGSIIVFHDSEKAFRNLEPILPEILKELKKQNYTMEKLELTR